MGRRVEHDPETWEPGMPIFVRPLSHENGNHVREMFQIMKHDPAKDCWCEDRAEWPEPRPQHDLAGFRHTILGLPYRE